MALEPKEISGVRKRRRHLSPERDRGLARDVGTLAKKDIRGLQEMQALEPRKKSGACKRRRHLNQDTWSGVGKRCRHLKRERDQEVARHAGT